MKLNPKSIGLLTLFVVSIYVMRDGGMSFTSPSKNLFRRILDVTNPSKTCAGVSLTSTFTAAELKNAANVQKSVKSIRGGNPLETMLTKGSVNSDEFITYAKTLIAPVAVWAIMFILSIIMCCCGCCNWCCMFGCCKNAKCCKCCKRPETDRKKKVYMGITLVLMLGLFSAGIAGATFSGSISKGMKVSYCVIINMAETLVYGQSSTKWLGLVGISDSLTDILNQFDGTVLGLTQNTDSAFTNLNATYATTKTAIDDFYTAWNANTVRRADPTASLAAFKPEYVKNLGPSTTSGTYLQAIFAELDGKFNALSQAQTSINDAITELKAQQTSIHSALDSGISSADDISKSMKDMIESLDSTGDTLNNIINIISKVILAIFIVYIVMGLLPIISMLLIHFLKIRFFSKVMHFSWCLMGFLAIIGFLICIIFYPFSLVFTEFCEVLTVSVSDEAYFNKTLKQVFGDGQAGDLTYTCMFGSGSALDQLGVSNSVSYFDTIFTQLDSVNSVVNLTSSDPVPSVTVDYSKWLLKATRDYLIAEGTETATDLKTLLSYTNKNANSCTNIVDTWALSGTNCTDTTTQGTKYDSSSATFYEPNPTCIGMDDWKATGYTGSQRYTTTYFPTSCSQVGGVNQDVYLSNFVDNFKLNRGDVTTLFGNLYTDFTATSSGTNYKIDDEQAQFGHYAYQCMQPFNTIKIQLMGIQDSLTGPTNGIIANTKCQFIGTDLRLLAAALCTGFIASIYQATVVLIIVSVFSFFGAICVMCTAKRINNEEKEEGSGKAGKSVTPDGYNQAKLH